MKSNNLKELKTKFPNDILLNEKLSKYSWFNLGGPAEVFFKPKNESELKKFLKICKNFNLKLTIIGAGSNTLIRDKGIKGATIKLGAPFSFCNLVNNEIIEAGAATLDRKVSSFALEKSLTGFEFLSCIPGSIGGAIIMNSGCYNEEISKILISIKTINHSGLEKIYHKEDLDFFYRGTSLPKDEIIISAKLKGSKFSKEKISEKQKNYLNKKKLAQPTGVKTCGSTFKNPENNKAWKLIKDSGCQNLNFGDAKISDKHCNFFINEGHASSSDIEKLIKTVQSKVLKEQGIKLDLEIKVIGDSID